MLPESDLATRALAVLEAARFGQLSASSTRQYVAVSTRLEAERDAAGPSWAGPTDGIASKRTAAVRRAAWTRRAHREVAAALRDLRSFNGSSVAAVERLARWVPEAEACPPGPERQVSGLLRGRPPNPVPAARSKKAGLREMPRDWMDVLWQEAVDRSFVHLDALSVIMVSGCRPGEACAGVGVRRVQGGIQIVIRGSKVRSGAGQPWRLLTVALDDGGPAAYLAALADRAGGRTVVKAACDRNALSMGISHVAAACLPGRRTTEPGSRLRGGLVALVGWTAVREDHRVTRRHPGNRLGAGARPAAVAVIAWVEAAHHHGYGNIVPR